MSIHKSKGLEFPVVFLVNTSRKFNAADLRAPVLVHPALGLGCKVTDLARGVEYPTLTRRAVASRLTDELLSEEMRVLYVAMTRAKERLYISCAAADPETLIEKLQSEISAPLDPEFLRSAQGMAALLTSVLDNTPKVAEYIAECRDRGIRLLPPDVNRSEADFTVEDGAIRFGMVAIKNIGRGFINSVMESRERDGDFRSLDDFCRRVAGKDFNRRAVENLIRAGAFDSLGAKRRQLIQVLPLIVDGVTDAARKNVEGQLDLFSLGKTADEAAAASSITLPDVEEYTMRELMSGKRSRAKSNGTFSGNRESTFGETI